MSTTSDFPQRITRARGLTFRRTRRGMALLMVMVGVIICTILTAGFLATQGTAIGIARNERDATKCRAIAQTGIDMSYWLIRNKSDWRETMSPGSWLANTAIGDGAVTVRVDREYLSIKALNAGSFYAYASNGAPYVVVGSTVDASTVVGMIDSNPVLAGVRGTIGRIFVNNGTNVGLNDTLFLVKPETAGNFADDPAQAVTVTSTGNYDNRTFTLIATIRPTGGGTVFRNGNFIQGNIQLGGDLLTAATIDSYNSSVAAYNAGSPGSNALFGSNSLANNALTVYFPSIFRGTYSAAPTALLGNVLSLVGLGAAAPTSVTNSLESRNPGTVVFPNTAGLTYRGNINVANQSTQNIVLPGKYDSITSVNTKIDIKASGIYYITGNISFNNQANAILNISDGVSAVVIVDGNVSTSKSITLTGTGQLALDCNGSVTFSAATVNQNGSTARLVIFGSNTCGAINITGNCNVAGSIYAPQAVVTMQTNAPKFYGAIIAHDLIMKNASQLHFDEALRSLYISNITGGSAAPGTADYRINITGGNGLAH